MRTEIHVWNVVVKFLGKQRLRERVRVWRPAVGEISLFAAGISLRISQEVENSLECVVTVSRLSNSRLCYFNTLIVAVRSGDGGGGGWTPKGKTASSGVWLFRGALRGGDVLSTLLAAGDWVEKGSYHTAWSILLLVLVRAGHSFGPQTGERCWPLLSGLWRAVAPLMKPWCAEGDVPIAANLFLYRGRSSHVGWHSDDEPLFGERGETKLIVSVSFWTSALFKWRRQSCPSHDGHSCWLGHGDILVMDGQCQDEFRHCTDPGSDQERINITFRWVKQHVASCSCLRTGGMLFANVCAEFFSF